jgi:outer membrane protein TolC
LLSAGVSQAQAPWPPPVEDPVLASLIEEALASSPELAAARSTAAAGEQRPAQERALPDTVVSIGYTNDGWSPSLGTRAMTTLGVFASQELPLASKRGLRGEIAVREARQKQEGAQRSRRRIIAEVKRAYTGLLLSRQLLELIADQGEIWKQIEGVVRARYTVGQGAQQDVLRVQVEVTRVEQFRVEQEAEAEKSRAELNRLLCRPPSAPVVTSARLSLKALDLDAEALSAWAEASSPEARSAEAGVERATLAVELAQKSKRPDFGVQAGYMNRGGLDPMWQAGVSLSLPLARKRLAAGVAEAEATLSAHRSVGESVRLRLRTRIQQRLAELKADERIATLYGEGIVPQDRMSLEAALANYQTGKVPFVSVLEALVTLASDQATQLRIEARHAQTLATLEEARVDGGADTP